MSVCGVPPTARVSRHELIRHRVALLTPANGDVADAWEPDLAWFYVVPIRVEDEWGVVPRVIVRSQPQPSVVDASRLDGCDVERINGFAVWRGEHNVHRKRSSSDLLALLSAVETCIAANDIRSVRIELDGQKYTLAAQ